MHKKFLITFMATMLTTCLSACHTTAAEAFEKEPKVATFQVDRPHEPTHFPGTVNVIGRIQCDRPVSRLK